ncbi:MFS transporter [Streptomyces sp. ID05-26A]|nr:MFS transporter [Streptomyces sp. ID05-26A]
MKSIDRTNVHYLISQVAYGLATGTFDMFYNLYLREVGIEAGQIGTIMMVGFIVMAVSVVPLSWLADRVGQRRTMLWTSFGLSVTMILFPFTTSFAGNLVLFSAANIFSPVMLATVTALVARNNPAEEQRFAMFRWGFVWFLASSALVNLLGGSLVRWTGNDGYQGPMIVAALLGLGIGLARIGMRERPAVRTEAVPAADEDVPRPRVWPVVAVAACVGAFSVLGVRFFNLLVTGMFDVSVDVLGYLMALERITSAVAVLVLAPLLKRVGPVAVTGVALILVLPLQMWGMFSASAAAFMVPYLLRQGVHYSQMPVLDLVTNRDVPNASKGFVNGAQKFGLFAGSGVAAQLYGLQLAEGAYQATLLISGACAVVAGVLYLVFFLKPVAQRGHDPGDEHRDADARAERAGARGGDVGERCGGGGGGEKAQDGVSAVG